MIMGWKQVSAQQTRLQASSVGKRVSVIATAATAAQDKDKKAAALKATYKKISQWPSDFGTDPAQTTPDRCVGCSTSFKF